jgi:hypothetical protein
MLVLGWLLKIKALFGNNWSMIDSVMVWERIIGRLLLLNDGE